jgi:RPA family protein
MSEFRPSENIEQESSEELEAAIREYTSFWPVEKQEITINRIKSHTAEGDLEEKRWLEEGIKNAESEEKKSTLSKQMEALDKIIKLR